MRFVSLRRLGLGVSAASCVLAIAGIASANGFEIPENGTEVMGRGGAWTARADSPLAAQLNPAGLAGQNSAFLVDSNFTWQSMCFQRAGGYSPSTAADGTVFQTTDWTSAGRYPQVCKNNGLGDVNIVPQLAYAHRVNDRLTLAFALVTPSAAGKADWPDRVDTPGGSAPAPQRYMLLSQNAIILFPTISAGYAVTPRLRFGASFQAVMSFLKFSNASMATQPDATEDPKQDLRADLTANNLFTPAFVLGGLWSPVDDLDIGAMFRWSAAIDIKNADVHIEGPYYGKSTNPTNTPAPTDVKAQEIKVPQPMDLRLGIRVHPRRAGGKVTKEWDRRDLLASDRFDFEGDFTWSRNKSFDTLGIFFPSGVNVAMGTNTLAGIIPQDAGVPHNWNDSFGIRIGGEYVAIPDKLGIRIGGFFQSNAVDPVFAGIDFLPAQMFGGFVGASFRVTPSVDLAAGLGHIFVTPVDNTGTGGGVHALLATQQSSSPECAQVAGPAYRSCEAINTGRYTAGYNMISLGATIRM